MQHRWRRARSREPRATAAAAAAVRTRSKSIGCSGGGPGAACLGGGASEGPEESTPLGQPHLLTRPKPHLLRAETAQALQVPLLLPLRLARTCRRSLATHRRPLGLGTRRVGRVTPADGIGS